jgi:uncharacterized protein (DUF2267 family)
MTHAFERTIQKSNQWLADTMDELGTSDPENALAALRAGLHTLRDRLTVEEAADLAAQLPMLIRGLFFENWRPAGVPMRLRTAEEFLDLIEDRLRPRPLHPRLVLEAVLHVLERHVGPGELAQVRHALPHTVRAMWPAPEPGLGQRPL